MKKLNIKGLDKVIFNEKLENGLDIYIVPYNNKNNYSVSYFTKFGSNYTSFIPNGGKDYIKVPDGIAHFLEHKMFETETGEDPFTFFSKSGTDCNAYTNFTETAYIFMGTNNFVDNLNYLLDYVNSPYFTDENVEKEKGIIAEELKMYKDDPFSELSNLTREATYHVDPYKVDIGGTVESIYTITKEDLYNCYNTFYQPSNMVLLVTGNVNPVEVINIVKANKKLMNHDSNGKIDIKKFKEPSTVVTPYLEKEFNVNNTKFGYTIKMPIPKDVDLFKYNAILGLAMDSLFGPSSIFKDYARRNKLMTNMNSYRDITNDYLSFVFMGESNRPDELISYINKTLEEKAFTESDISRIKKVWLAGEGMAIDDINATIRGLEEDIVQYGKVLPNKCDIIRSITYKEVKDTFSKLDFSNTSTVILKPKEK